jgi:hypothetical protein
VDPDTFAALVTDSGGGMVTLLVNRETYQYPRVGSQVLVEDIGWHPDRDLTWRCDWEPDDLNPGPECPYCLGQMCARMDNLNCSHDQEERHGYPTAYAEYIARNAPVPTLPPPDPALMDDNGVRPWREGLTDRLLCLVVLLMAVVMPGGGGAGGGRGSGGPPPPPPPDRG